MNLAISAMERLAPEHFSNLKTETKNFILPRWWAVTELTACPCGDNRVVCYLLVTNDQTCFVRIGSYVHMAMEQTIMLFDIG